MTHAELEDELDFRGRELLRRMLQEHLTLRAANEPRLAAVADDAESRARRGRGRSPPDADQCVRPCPGGTPGLPPPRPREPAPADAALNLPVERHSHGLRRLAAIESHGARSSRPASALREPPASRSANARSRCWRAVPWSTSRTTTPPADPTRPRTGRPGPVRGRQGHRDAARLAAPATAKAAAKPPGTDHPPVQGRVMRSCA